MTDPTGPAQGRRAPPRGAAARVLHLGPLGQRVPAGEGGRLPPARLRDGLVHLPHRVPGPAVEQEPGADQAHRGDVQRPRAGDDPHGGGGRGARRRRRGRRPPRRQLLRVGQRRRRVHRARHGGQGRGRHAPTATRSASPSPRTSRGRTSGRSCRPGTCPRASSWGPACTTSPTAGSARPSARSGQNVELPNFTQALYEARELAMTRMQDEGNRLGATGIVGVRLEEKSHQWGSHTIEFLSLGTAVTKTQRRRHPARRRPSSSRSTTDGRGPARPPRGGAPPARVGLLLLGTHRPGLRGLPADGAAAGRPGAGVLRDAVGVVRRLGSPYMRGHVPVRRAGGGQGVYAQNWYCPHGFVSAEHRTWGQNYEQTWVEDAWLARASAPPSAASSRRPRRSAPTGSSGSPTPPAP